MCVCVCGWRASASTSTIPNRIGIIARNAEGVVSETSTIVRREIISEKLSWRKCWMIAIRGPLLPLPIHHWIKLPLSTIASAFVCVPTSSRLWYAISFKSEINRESSRKNLVSCTIQSWSVTDIDRYLTFDDTYSLILRLFLKKVAIPFTLNQPSLAKR